MEASSVETETFRFSCIRRNDLHLSRYTTRWTTGGAVLSFVRWIRVGGPGMNEQ